jgi:lipopolysaccharide export LptBFGC system permease protein LptF
LPELWAARADPPVKPSPPEISAEWNMRLVMILSFPILPLLAISLGLRDPRQNRYYGIVMGLAVVVLYFQAIGFGEALVKRAIFPASVSLWLPFAVLASFAIWHFRRVVSAWPSRRVSGLLPAGANSALRAHGSRT